MLSPERQKEIRIEMLRKANDEWIKYHLVERGANRPDLMETLRSESSLETVREKFTKLGGTL